MGVDGLKLHPLHVVKHTVLAKEWRQGEYQPLTLDEYIRTAVRLIEHTPPEIIYHRLTGSAAEDVLLAPQWCSGKWHVLNGITERLQKSNSRQGAALS